MTMSEEKRNTLKKVLLAAMGAGALAHGETSAAADPVPAPATATEAGDQQAETPVSTPGQVDYAVENAIEKFQMMLLPRTFSLQTFWNDSAW